MKTVTIRIVDNRQSKQVPFWKRLAVFGIGPLMIFVPGILADSAAMQWAGFILLMVLIVAFLGVWADQFKTLDEAKEALAKIEADHSDHEWKQQSNS